MQDKRKIDASIESYDLVGHMWKHCKEEFLDGLCGNEDISPLCYVELVEGNLKLMAVLRDQQGYFMQIHPLIFFLNYPY